MVHQLTSSPAPNSSTTAAHSPQQPSTSCSEAENGRNRRLERYVLHGISLILRCSNQTTVTYSSFISQVISTSKLK